MSQREQLLRATRQATRRRAELRAQVASQGDRPLAPGDVFTVEPGSGVEWVVLAREPGRLLAVPADGGTLLGSGDLALADSAAAGPLTLRCRFAVCLETGGLETGGLETGGLGVEVIDPRRRTAVLAPSDVARAHDRWLQISEGVFTGSVLGREVDEDPEYQDWLDEVVRPAHRALSELTARPVPRRSAHWGGWSRSAVLRIAASLLVVTSALLAATWLWHRQNLEDLTIAHGVAERQHRQEVSRLEAERDRLRTELEQAAGEREAIEQPLRERLAILERDLETALLEAATWHPYVATLELPGESGAEVRSLRVPEDASHVVLVMPLGAGATAGGYRAEVTREGEQAALWTSGRLDPNESGEVAVGIPSEELPPGRYRVRVTPEKAPRPAGFIPRRGSTAGSSLELIEPADFPVRIETP